MVLRDLKHDMIRCHHPQVGTDTLQKTAIIWLLKRKD